MRIVQVSIGVPPPVFGDWGGAIQRRVRALSEALSARGHDVTIFSPGPATRTARRDGLTVNYIRTLSPEPWSRAEFIARAVRQIRADARPDVAHFHSEPEAGLIAGCAGAATVLSYDNFFFGGHRSRVLKRAHRHALGRFDLLLPCSRYCMVEFERYWGAPGGRPMQVLYNGVDTAQFAPKPSAGSAERARLGVEGPTILFLGRVSEQKGVPVLLAAFEQVRRCLDQVNLVVAGPLEQFNEAGRTSGSDWAARISRAGALYVGPVREDRLAGLYNAADILVLPTLRLEMFGMVAAEALACGTPVVASNHGGIPEVVDPRAGALVPVGDVEALADALCRLLTEDDLLTSKREAARDSVLHLAWPEIATRLESLYRGLLPSR